MPSEWMDDLNAYGAFYENRIAEVGHHLHAFHARRMAFFHPPAGASIIDLGCGTGGCVIEYARRGHYVVGVDIAESALQDIERRIEGEDYAAEVDLTQSDLESYEPPGEFDCVICSEVLEHVIDPEPIYKTMARCVKVGGIVYVTAPSVLIGPPTHVRGISPMEAKESLENAGLVVDALYLTPNRVPNPLYKTTVAVATKEESCHE